MDIWKIAKWALIAIAIWWAWSWIKNNFGSSPDTGSSEVYPAPYAAPLDYSYPVTGWWPYWYGGASRGRMPRRPVGPRRGRRF